MKIILDGKKVNSLVPESLPMLIHGEDRSGASLYMIALAAQWASQGYSVICLCGYTMAEEAFSKLAKSKTNDAQFYTKDKMAEFIERVGHAPTDAIIIIKNIELFDEAILNSLIEKKNLIISGDLQKSAIKDSIMKIDFVTKIFFSSFADISLPQLAKYEGYVISDDYKGITKLEE